MSEQQLSAQTEAKYAGYMVNGPGAGLRLVGDKKKLCWTGDNEAVANPIWYEFEEIHYPDGSKLGYWRQQHIIFPEVDRLKVLLLLIVQDYQAALAEIEELSEVEDSNLELISHLRGRIGDLESALSDSDVEIPAAKFPLIAERGT